MSSPSVVDPWQGITLEELAKHTDVDNNDAWMCVKGVVYDVAEYAARHPGGIEKIRKYAGKDATETFNHVHPYVDQDAILFGKQVGILKGHPQAPKRSFMGKLREMCCFGRHYKPPTTYFLQDSIVATYIVEFKRASKECEWTMGVMEKKYLQVFKILDNRKAWMSTYELPEPLFNEQLTVDFRRNYQHAEITLRKPIPTTIWANQLHGLKECGQFVGLQEGHSKYPAYILYKRCLTSNVLMFAVQICSSARIGVPMGFHVRISVGDVSRPYTPAMYSLTESDTPEVTHPEEHQYQNPDHISMLYFIIKIYKNGALGRQLDAIPVDDGRELPTLHISTPHGYFNPAFLDDFTVLFLIAGGTGITPMIKIIRHFMSIHNTMRGKRVVLLYFCHQFHDLIWRTQFEEVAKNASWFLYLPVLTQPSEKCNWEGLRGRINPQLVATCLSKLKKHNKGLKKALVCGTPGFNSAVVDSLGGTVLLENIFVFSG